MLSVARWHTPKDGYGSWVLPKIACTHAHTCLCEQKPTHRLKTKPPPPHTRSHTRSHTLSLYAPPAIITYPTVMGWWLWENSHFTQIAFFVKGSACACAVCGSLDQMLISALLRRGFWNIFSTCLRDFFILKVEHLNDSLVIHQQRSFNFQSHD